MRFEKHSVFSFTILLEIFFPDLNSEMTATFSLGNNLSSFCMGTYQGRTVSFSLHVQSRARGIFHGINSDWLQLLIHIHD